MTVDEILNKYQDIKESSLKQKLKEFCLMNGFTEDGFTYIPVKMNNEINAKCRHACYHFSPGIGWHGTAPLTGVKLVKIDIRDISIYDTKYENYKIIKGLCRMAVGKVCAGQIDEEEKKSNFVAEVGDSINKIVELVSIDDIKVSNDYGNVVLLKLRDTDGNLYTWFQRSFSKIMVKNFFAKYAKDNKWVSLRGKVKDHETYRGVHYTKLNLCEIKSIIGDGITMGKYQVISVIKRKARNEKKEKKGNNKN